ncbi:MAG TPA: helix-turn-helix domain-containing protein [Candidatus Desulfovibrio gallistercoris]|uniref:helix-turn-helix domain-containing protein n=1 Tax=uncultured Desulfovibrio sp. TaxID=167968 RepID=UPI001F8F5847|nr:helix-turn-helix domain-containing protein [uncultured Desulfovibrio sp.]HJA75459.1 helix-turn-helix domain-containing protein [Candidatus Desulfovibrio gallistercoris]
METLGDRIKIIRGETSQTQFSSSLGITQTKLSRYERNTTPPEIDFLVRLSRQYAVSLDWLLLGNGCSESSRPSDGDDANIQTELAAERAERRELTAENRKLYREKEVLYKEREALLREIGELREKIARLEERKCRIAVTANMAAQDSGAA